MSPPESSYEPPPVSVTPLADPVAEARRLVDAGRQRGIAIRVLGGVAVYMQSPHGRPLLPRTLKDIDLVTPRGQGRAAGALLSDLGYVGDEMFNALRGDRRQLFYDAVSGRQLDLFVGEFSMCHSLTITARLDRDPYTIAPADLLLTKLQIVELNERDEKDIYTLCYHHDVSIEVAGGIEADVIAAACAADWGLWRTCKDTIMRCRADLGDHDVGPDEQELIDARLGQLWEHIERVPKAGKWKRRNRVGDRVRWYQEPEEV